MLALLEDRWHSYCWIYRSYAWMWLFSPKQPGLMLTSAYEVQLWSEGCHTRSPLCVGCSKAEPSGRRFTQYKAKYKVSVMPHLLPEPSQTFICTASQLLMNGRRDGGLNKKKKKTTTLWSHHSHTMFSPNIFLFSSHHSSLESHHLHPGALIFLASGRTFRFPDVPCSFMETSLKGRY